MKKLLCAIFILMICSGNAQIQSQGSVSLTPAPYDIFFQGLDTGSMPPLLVSFNNKLDTNSGGVTLTCPDTLPGFTNLATHPSTFFISSPTSLTGPNEIFCGSLQLPAGKQWTINYSIDLSILDPEEVILGGQIQNEVLRGYLYYGQTTELQFPNPDNSSPAKVLNAYRIQVGNSTLCSTPTSTLPTSLQVSDTVVLNPQHSNEPVYLYLLMGLLTTGPRNIIVAPAGKIMATMSVSGIDVE